MESHKAQIIKSFTGLQAWKEGHKLVLIVYTMTKAFPSEEKFDLTSQIRRAAVSVTSNVAEGFSRNSSKEKVQFYHTSLGSLTELQNQLIIAKDLCYIDAYLFKDIAAQTVLVSKLINGLIKSAKTLNT